MIWELSLGNRMQYKITHSKSGTNMDTYSQEITNFTKLANIKNRKSRKVTNILAHYLPTIPLCYFFLAFFGLVLFVFMIMFSIERLNRYFFSLAQSNETIIIIH